MHKVGSLVNITQLFVQFPVPSGPTLLLCNFSGAADGLHKGALARAWFRQWLWATCNGFSLENHGIDDSSERGSARRAPPHAAPSLIPWFLNENQVNVAQTHSQNHALAKAPLRGPSAAPENLQKGG